MAELMDRITVNPRQCGGRPCVRGMRIRVVDVLFRPQSCWPSRGRPAVRTGGLVGGRDAQAETDAAPRRADRGMRSLRARYARLLHCSYVLPERGCRLGFRATRNVTSPLIDARLS